MNILKKIFAFIVKIRYVLLGLWGALLIASIVLTQYVNINYDSTQYLPEDTRTTESLKVMEAEFGLVGQASLMVENIDIEKAINIKEAVKNIDGVGEVIWLDTFIEAIIEALQDVVEVEMGDVIDVSKFIENNLSSLTLSIPGIDSFYKSRSALYQIMFEEDDYSLKTGNAIERIREKVGNIISTDQSFAMGGSAVNTYNMRILTTSEVFKITLIAIPIVLLILIIFTSSWVEPILFLIVVGVSVLVNMGTNAFLPSVSFLTNSTASLLQLAISMDYAIFLLHQYTKERELGLEKKEAIKEAMSKSFLSIGASMLTTIAGFVALMFMRYSFGLDLGIVMVKGICISLISTFTLMPALILIFDKWILKTRHRPLFPKLGGLSKYIVKTKYVMPALMLLIAVPAFMAQNNNRFMYGEAAMSVSPGSEPAEELDRIERKFGKNNMLVILAPNDSENAYDEQERMIARIQSDLQEYEPTVQASATLYQMFKIGDLFQGLVGKDILPGWLEDIMNSSDAITRESVWEYIPTELMSQLESDNYSRIIISLKTDSESEKAFLAVEKLKSIISEYEVKFSKPLHLVGMTSSVMEIKEVVEEDFIFVNILSIVLVFVIILASFRSLSIPIILVLCIELSIWINMAIPFLQGSSLIFIGYMIVSSIQLGATIDYGILFSQHYLESRATLDKKEAVKHALNNSGHSILTSSLILTTVGYSLKFFSSVQGVGALGELIGRGAALSGLLVIILLPQLLYLFDHMILKTTRGLKFKDERVTLLDASGLFKDNIDYDLEDGKIIIIQESDMKDIKTKEDISKDDK